MTENPMPWFRCFPAKWLKALGAMKPDEGYVYLIVCLMIYDRGSACPDTLDAIARRTGLNRRRTSEALDRLFKSGKLVRQGDGIMNPFAEQVITEQTAFRERRSVAGAKGASALWGKTERNQGKVNGDAIDVPMANDGQLQLQIQEERKKEGVEPRAKRRAPRTLIDPEWNPSEEDVAYATKKGFGVDRWRRMARSFVNYHLRQGTLIAGAIGLAAAWRQWCNNEVIFDAERESRQSKTNGPTMFDIASGNHGRTE